MKELPIVFLIGFPASGKSTYARSLVNEGYTVVSADFVSENIRKKYNLSSVNDAHVLYNEEINAEMKKALSAAVGLGAPIVIDALNLSLSKRKILQNIVNEQNPNLYQFEAVVFYPPEADEHAKRIFKRHMTRGDSDWNIADAFAMERWEKAYDKPTSAENFSKITYVGSPPKETLMNMGM